MEARAMMDVGVSEGERVYYYVRHRCPFDYFKGVGKKEKIEIPLEVEANYGKCHFIVRA